MSNCNERIIMIRDNLQDLPDFQLPDGYRIRPYGAGDEVHWYRIHDRADDYFPPAPGLFRREFGSDTALLTQRQFYLWQGHTAIGTATAWYNEDFSGHRWGRVHWVAIVPEMQGRGLSRPLLARVCRELADLGHDRAYLTTSTARPVAVKLYRRFGFRPEIRNDDDRRRWQLVES